MVKTRFLILLCLLWMLFQSGNVYGIDKRELYIQVPAQLSFEKYRYELDVSLSYYAKSVEKSGEVFRFEIQADGNGIFRDEQVKIRFLVRDWQRRATYVAHTVVLEVKTDSVFYVIPELSDETALDAALNQEQKAYRKEQRGEDFAIFMTSWDSRFMFINFYQGNRLFGELSFGTARYSQVPVTLFAPVSEPGFIRGPVYGAEFNFRWRKDDFILGPKLGFQVASRFVNLGLSAVYYTDFTYGSFCLKPRIGLNPSIPWVNFSYEYAIRFGPDYFGNRINSHQFSVYFLIPLRLEEYK